MQLPVPPPDVKITGGERSIGSKRVNRGGGWNDNAVNCRSAYRNRNTPDNRNNNLGFRVASAPSALRILSSDGTDRFPSPAAELRFQRAKRISGRPVLVAKANAPGGQPYFNRSRRGGKERPTGFFFVPHETPNQRGVELQPRCEISCGLVYRYYAMRKNCRRALKPRKFRMVQTKVTLRWPNL